MEQNSIAKIVSLHMEQCSFDCPNTDVCYHKRKEISSDNTEEILPFNFREEMLEQGYILHESVCSESNINFKLLRKFSNYNITLPYLILEKHLELKDNKEQLQVTVYTKEQANAILEYQKLYLIKNDATYSYAINEHLFNITNMHFCINQAYINKAKLQEITYRMMLSSVSNVTMDSCVTSWLVNGQCGYDKGAYVDINFDGTVRSCPFNAKGVKLSTVYNGTYDSLFTLDCAPEACKYSEIFSHGELDGAN